MSSAAAKTVPQRWSRHGSAGLPRNLRGSGFSGQPGRFHWRGIARGLPPVREAPSVRSRPAPATPLPDDCYKDVMPDWEGKGFRISHLPIDSVAPCSTSSSSTNPPFSKNCEQGTSPFAPTLVGTGVLVDAYFSAWTMPAFTRCSHSGSCSYRSL